jgi:hypothetical protein
MATWDTYSIYPDDFTGGFFDLLHFPRKISDNEQKSQVWFKHANLRKYQKRDFATTSLGAKMRMR